MTTEKAIELLEGWQSQIIDGKPIFREIADVIRSLTDTVAAHNGHAAGENCASASGSAATVPLSKIVEHMIGEARRERAQQGKKILKYNAGFYDGECFALGKLLETVCPKQYTKGTSISCRMIPNAHARNLR